MMEDDNSTLPDTTIGGENYANLGSTNNSLCHTTTNPAGIAGSRNSGL